jgi:phage-related protein
MVSRGEVDAATFRKVIEDNIGGAALESGNTTRGAFANMLASLSRLGEGFAGPALGAARDFFNEVTKVSDAVKTTLAPAFDDIQYWVDGLDFKFSDRVMTFLTPLLETINNISAAARDGSLAQWFKDAAKYSPLMNVALGVATAVAPLIPLFKALGERVGPVLADTFGKILKAIEPLIPVLAGSLADAIIQLAPPVTELVLALLPLIPPLVELVSQILPLLIDLLEPFIPVITSLAEVLADAFNAGMAFQSLINGATSFGEFTRQIAEMSSFVGLLWQVFLFATTSISSSLSMLSALWNAMWGSITSFLDDAWRNIMNTINALWTFLPEQFRSGVDSVIGYVSTIPVRIAQVMSGVGTWLVDSGRALVQGFIDGISSMFGEVAAAVGDVMDFIGGFFPHSPAKRGPFSGAGWTAVADGGASLMEQFTLGAERFTPQLSFDGLTGALMGAAAPAVPGPAQVKIVQNNKLDHMPPEEAVELTGQKLSSLARQART